jgi:hypothetical protein
MLDEHPYLARQLSVFYRHAHLGIPRGNDFIGRVSPRSETRRCKGTQGLDRFGTAESVIPYVLYPTSFTTVGAVLLAYE